MQLSYLARTWFGDTLAMVVFGNSEPATVGGFGDDVTVASCRFVFRSSSEHVVAEIKAEAQVGAYTLKRIFQRGAYLTFDAYLISPRGLVPDTRLA